MPIKLKIVKLMSEHEGAMQEYEVNVPVYDDKEFHLYPDQTITFQAYRIQDGLAIRPLSTTIVGKTQCVATLKEFDLEVETVEVEKQFYIRLPELAEDEEAEPIDTKTMEIDVEEQLREAIFLGLPPVIKCPEAEDQELLKGGDDLPESNTQNPFAGLKDMLG